jgi:4-carboxymuconolactone decarboxylase
MPRIAPVADRTEIAPEYQSVVQDVLDLFGGIRGPHSILLHSPRADERVMALGNFFRHDSLVKSPERELAIITAAREKDCLYIWAAQSAASRRVGVREEAIAAVKERADPAKLEPQEAAIVTYVQQLFRKNRVDQQSFDALEREHGKQWVLELTTMVGYYAMLAGVVNAFELMPPPDGDKLPV